jgi:hypothetical protein
MGPGSSPRQGTDEAPDMGLFPTVRLSRSEMFELRDPEYSRAHTFTIPFDPFPKPQTFKINPV